MMKNRARALLPILVFAVLLLVFPASAYALYNDVTDSYSATQDVTTKGDVLTAADVPEGTYPITISCSSYMCKFTNATLTSAQGQLWATFTLSKAYDALYFGTAEEAAAQTNEDGTDYSQYYVTPPLGEYVSREFSLPIPALNQKVTLATYSGGSKGTEGGVWYTRTVVFNSSDAVENAVKGITEQPAKEETKQPEGAKQEAATSKVEEATTQDASSGKKKSKDKDTSSSKKKAETKETPEQESNTDANDATTVAGTEQGAGGSGATTGSAGTGSSASEDKNASAGAPESASSASASSAAAVPNNAKVGQSISVVGAEAAISDTPTPAAQADRQRGQDQSVPLLAVVAGVVAVNAALAGAFVFGLHRAWHGGLIQLVRKGK